MSGDLIFNYKMIIICFATLEITEINLYHCIFKITVDKLAYLSYTISHFDVKLSIGSMEKKNVEYCGQFYFALISFLEINEKFTFKDQQSHCLLKEK